MRQTFKRKRGFLTFAQNGRHDYLRMAYALALSLKATQAEVPHLSVLVTPGTTIPDRYRAVFDEVIDIPWLDEARFSDWKLENEWKAYHATPYEETIKLDADMLFPVDVAAWWPILARQDVMACTQVLTYRGEVVTSDYYRKTFAPNRLPNIYTAFMFFRYSDRAFELFEMVETIFHNWEKFRFEFMVEPRPAEFSTDVAFALAMRLLDIADDCTSPLPYPSFVHMKTAVQNWPERSASESWTRNIQSTLTDDLVLSIGRFRQMTPVHYHDKAFLTDEMIATYEKALDV